MKFTNWINQYIPLIIAKPDYILACKDNVFSEDEKLRLAEKIKLFPQVRIEIGSGSGAHLIEQAARNPYVLFIGFELRFKRVFKTAEKAESQSLKNVLVIRHDARKIHELFEPESLSGVYINFPDPWSDKKRWSKHKLFYGEFLPRLTKLLKKDSFISYKTDHPLCFAENRSIILNNDSFREVKFTEDLHGSEYKDENIETEFEKLFLSKNQRIFFTEIIKK